MASTLSLTSLLRSNDAPLPSQRILTEQIVHQKQAELSGLDNAISRIRLTLRKLEDDRAELASEINQYSSVLSPIRLPPEMIAEIFLYFAPILPADAQSGDLVKPPWILGHICRLWRAVSLSLGELWSVLDTSLSWLYVECRAPEPVRDVDDDEKRFTDLPLVGGDPREYAEGYAIETTLDYIGTCLTRAGNRPLSIRFNGEYGTPTLLIFDVLLTNPARWQEVAFVESPLTLVEYVCAKSGYLDKLHKITLSFSPRYGHPPKTLPSRPFTNVPNLTDLTLTYVFLPAEASLSLPWSRLMRYCERSCSWTSWSEALAVYRKLTNLCVLCLESPSFPGRAPPVLDPLILLPNLHVASFYFRSPHVYDNFLRALQMPVLQAFSVEQRGCRHLHSCLPTSSPHLKVLRARIDGYCQNNLTFALEMFPELTELTIDAARSDLISRPDISRLIPFRDQLPLAPNLETIRLSNRSFVNKACQWKTLADMLQARFQPTLDGVARLRRFEFYTSDYSNDHNVVTALETLKMQRQWDIRVRPRSQFPAWDDRELLESSYQTLLNLGIQN